jgi:hypothetical protein
MLSGDLFATREQLTLRYGFVQDIARTVRESVSDEAVPDFPLGDVRRKAMFLPVP